MSPQRKENLDPQKTSITPIGVLMLALAFLPWIPYWLLADVQQPSGILIALGITCGLLAQQIWSRAYRLLDITSFLFFTVAALVTYATETVLFVTHAGPISFGTLMAVALISMLIRRPFTGDAARYEYPRKYWDNPAFIALHSIITGVWAAVFFVTGIIVTLSTIPLTGTLPIGLMIAGFVFSIVFQSKGPAFLVKQRYRPFEWHVPLAPSTRRQQVEYDVAIIGAGIGGLTCAALLAKQGYKVLVMEQQSQVGGYCRSLRRGDYAFSAGVTGISGVWSNGPVQRMLTELGVSTEGRFVRHSRAYVHKGQILNVGPVIQSITESLAGAYPEEKEHIDTFYREAAEAFHQLHEYSSQFDAPLPDHLVVRLMGDEAAANLPRKYPALYDWLDKTLKQKLDEHFENESLKALVGSSSGQNGTKPEATPGLRALIGCIGPQLEGSHFPAGGPSALAETLAAAVESYGGTILLNYRADRILTEKRQVRGIRSGEELYQAHVVVANVNPRTCVLQLVEATEVGGLYIDFIKSIPMSRSAFIVYAGIEDDLSSYPSLIQNVDGDFTMLINSNVDPQLAPRGRSSLTLIAPMGYRDFPARDDERDYDDRKRQFAALLMRKAAEVIPGLTDRVAVLDAATPRTLESYTSIPEGALYGFDQSVDSRRPHFRSPIKGLYFAGACTFPGAGIESVVMSGMICANDIAGWRRNDRD